MKRNKVLSIVGGISLAIALAGCSSEPVEEPKGYDVAELDKSSDKVEVKNEKYSEEFKKYEEDKEIKKLAMKENALKFLTDSGYELGRSVDADIKDKSRLLIIVEADAGWNYYMYLNEYWSEMVDKQIQDYHTKKLDYNTFEANLLDVQKKYAKVVMAFDETIRANEEVKANPDEYRELFSSTSKLLHQRQEDFDALLKYEKLNVSSDSQDQRDGFFKYLEGLDTKDTKELKEQLKKEYEKVYEAWKQKVINGEM